MSSESPLSDLLRVVDDEGEELARRFEASKAAFAILAREQLIVQIVHYGSVPVERAWPPIDPASARH
jgi:hypothetical protein